MDKNRSGIRIMDVIMAVLGIVFLLGIIFLFGPCGPKEDGSYMTCHWAGNAETGIASVLLILSLMQVFIKNKDIKTGISLSMIPVSLLGLFIPGRLINLCMMHDMACHLKMHPAVTVCTILFAVMSIINIVLLRRGEKK